VSSLHPGESMTIWLDTKTIPAYPKLSQSLSTDVCIVGGGIAGLTTAYLLMKEGKSVCVLEDFELGSGQTGRTTAQFVTALDDRYYTIEKNHGVTGAWLAVESHSAAITMVKKIITKENINCDMVTLDGYLFAGDPSHIKLLRMEYDAATRAGLYGIELLNSSPLNTMSTGPCLRFPNQLQIHPMKYLSALSNLIKEGGGKIFTRTHVSEVKGGERASVHTKDGFIVDCGSVVVATNAPINNLFAIHTKQHPYRSYVIGMQIPKNNVPTGLYWDTLDPYHYLRVETSEPDYDVLIVGGEDHKTGQDIHPETRYQALESWTRERFPLAGDIHYRWSGQIMEPLDGLAYLGHNPMDKNNVYVITGDSGNGMTHCTIGAILITDQIMGRKNPWEELYNPSRISFKTTGEFVRENANVAAQYADWFSQKAKPYADEIPYEEGVVFRDGLKMIAAFKNRNGSFEMMSAACPHLGGVVHWNSVEKSWDCPCHGSRFDYYGKVIEGPACEDLKKVMGVELAAEPIRASESGSFPENYPPSFIMHGSEKT
jgi:glycine/D-amino acid oxidase-like deaminating enzyme/nitrite reductase/ring-hydroxylating ferredoxin subunit